MADFPQLLRRYVESSDQAAFAELVRGQVDLVYSIALRQASGDRHLAEEVTQEVFSLLARKAAGLADRPTLTGWLYYTAILSTNSAIRREQRRRAREHRALLEETIMNPKSAEPGGDPDWETTRPALDHAIRRLTDRERDAVLLRYFENRSFPEIGRLLEVSEDAARMRVERALEKAPPVSPAPGRPPIEFRRAGRPARRSQRDGRAPDWRPAPPRPPPSRPPVSVRRSPAASSPL